jgi:hypothetical protein
MAVDGFESLRLGAAPLVGREQAAVGLALLGPVVVGAVLVVLLPRLSARLRWLPLLVVLVLASVGWVAAVNLTRPDGLTRPLERPGDEYLEDVDAVATAGPHRFLVDFPDQVDDYAVHTRSHPPGFVLTLWALDEVGLGGSGWAAALVVSAGAVGLAMVAIGLREVAGEAVARRAVPFLVLAPAVLWIGSTADALFAAVAATGVVLLVTASGRPDGGRGRAFGGGAVLGVGLCLSYGLALAGLIALPVLVARRRLGLVLPAAAGAAVVVAAFWLAGFDYAAGFAASRREVAESVQSTRPLALFLLLNLAVLGIACGPAVVAGLAALRDRPTWLLVGGAVLAVVVADLSGLSKGEVERIWLPFAFWLVPAAVAHDPPARGWLAAQVAVTVAIQAMVKTGW